MKSKIQNPKSKLAFIFPGQGSQCIGMGREFHDNFASAKRIFEEASSVLGLDMAGLCFEGPMAELSLTENTQPAILTASMAILSVFNEEVSIKPNFLSGHSLGEYTALVASGAMKFKDAVRLVRMRGRFMQDAVPEGVGAMAAVLGLTGETVAEICREASSKDNIVVPANFNTPEQTVISGHREAVARASDIAKARKAKRVIPLPVSVPSHSPLMKIAAERLAKELGGIDIQPITIPVVTNVEALPLSAGERAKELLIKQLYSPVRWVESVRTMTQDGVESVIEIGPGRVLTGLVKRIDGNIKTMNVERPEDIKTRVM